MDMALSFEQVRGSLLLLFCHSCDWEIAPFWGKSSISHPDTLGDACPSNLQHARNVPWGLAFALLSFQRFSPLERTEENTVSYYRLGCSYSPATQSVASGFVMNRQIQPCFPLQLHRGRQRLFTAHSTHMPRREIPPYQ